MEELEEGKCMQHAFAILRALQPVVTQHVLTETHVYQVLLEPLP